MIKIVKYPNIILNTTSKEVKSEEINEINALSSEITTYIKNKCYKGFGTISLCQVGILKRIFIARLPAIELTVINPILIRAFGGTTKSWEMCLSVPEFVGKVRRHKKVEVEFLDLNFKSVHITLSQPLSRIFLHEVDHLDGKLFLDRIEDKQTDLMSREDYFSRKSRKDEQ
ncbi:MAG: peptide deformylase [Patescibacteria group bacterium]|nr:peptide deformylase [Patescibacteria group bacterium]